MIQEERLKRAREKANTQQVTYMNPRKPPEPMKHDEKATFKPHIDERTKLIIKEKREAHEIDDQPTRYLRPVDFVIYDP